MYSEVKNRLGLLRQDFPQLTWLIGVGALSPVRFFKQKPLKRDLVQAV
tara:strand:- start:5410 stop:5553 length:144 start_codon:yes stop_codon:yes gene_type:complete